LLGEGLDGWPVVDEVVVGPAARLIVGEDKWPGDGEEEEDRGDHAPLSGRGDLFGWALVRRHM